MYLPCSTVKLAAATTYKVMKDKQQAVRLCRIPKFHSHRAMTKALGSLIHLPRRWLQPTEGQVSPLWIFGPPVFWGWLPLLSYFIRKPWNGAPVWILWLWLKMFTGPGWILQAALRGWEKAHPGEFFIDLCSPFPPREDTKSNMCKENRCTAHTPITLPTDFLRDLGVCPSELFVLCLPFPWASCWTSWVACT